MKCDVCEDRATCEILVVNFHGPPGPQSSFFCEAHGERLYDWMLMNSYAEAYLFATMMALERKPARRWVSARELVWLGISR